MELPENAVGSIEVEASSSPVRPKFHDDQENESSQKGNEERDVEEGSTLCAGQHLSSLCHPHTIHAD